MPTAKKGLGPSENLDQDLMNSFCLFQDPSGIRSSTMVSFEQGQEP